MPPLTPIPIRPQYEMGVPWARSKPTNKAVPFANFATPNNAGTFWRYMVPNNVSRSKRFRSHRNRNDGLFRPASGLTVVAVGQRTMTAFMVPSSFPMPCLSEEPPFDEVGRRGLYGS